MSATVATSEQTLFLLKMRGPQTAQQLAVLLDVTSMGARRQLEAAHGRLVQNYGFPVRRKIARNPRRENGVLPAPAETPGTLRRF